MTDAGEPVPPAWKLAPPAGEPAPPTTPDWPNEPRREFGVRAPGGPVIAIFPTGQGSPASSSFTARPGPHGPGGRPARSWPPGTRSIRSTAAIARYVGPQPSRRAVRDRPRVRGPGRGRRRGGGERRRFRSTSSGIRTAAGSPSARPSGRTGSAGSCRTRGRRPCRGDAVTRTRTRPRCGGSRPSSPRAIGTRRLRRSCGRSSGCPRRTWWRSAPTRSGRGARRPSGRRSASFGPRRASRRRSRRSAKSASRSSRSSAATVPRRSARRRARWMRGCATGGSSRPRRASRGPPHPPGGFRGRDRGFLGEPGMADST